MRAFWNLFFPRMPNVSVLVVVKSRTQKLCSPKFSAEIVQLFCVWNCETLWPALKYTCKANLLKYSFNGCHAHYLRNALCYQHVQGISFQYDFSWLKRVPGTFLSAERHLPNDAGVRWEFSYKLSPPNKCVQPPTTAVQLHWGVKNTHTRRRNKVILKGTFPHFPFASMGMRKISICARHSTLLNLK